MEWRLWALELRSRPGEAFFLCFGFFFKASLSTPVALSLRSPLTEKAAGGNHFAVESGRQSDCQSPSSSLHRRAVFHFVSHGMRSAAWPTIGSVTTTKPIPSALGAHGGGVGKRRESDFGAGGRSEWTFRSIMLDCCHPPCVQWWWQRYEMMEDFYGLWAPLEPKKLSFI